MGEWAESAGTPAARLGESGGHAGFALEGVSPKGPPLRFMQTSYPEFGLETLTQRSPYAARSTSLTK